MLKPGDQLGRYKITRALSRGGMAQVYEGRRVSIAGVNPKVAIKVIRPEHQKHETFQELFINEARLGASMVHQNLVQILDFEQQGDMFYIVMEYAEGLTLRQMINTCKRHDIKIPAVVVAEIGRQATQGLHFAHNVNDEKGRPLGLVHRDIKPSNLILNAQGVVKVLDFGISKGNLLLERKGAVRGTWGYMSPEQAMGKSITAVSDVFGLGIALTELTTLKSMFKGKSPDEIKRLLAGDHPAMIATQVDVECAPLIGPLVRSLQRDPLARYSSSLEFGRALERLVPDHIQATKQLMEFVELIMALLDGSPVPVKTPSGDGMKKVVLGPLVDSTGSIYKRRRHSGIALASGAVVALFSGALAVALLVAPPEVPNLSSSSNDAQAVELALDEPSGPAGVDAPGEREPQPPAARTAPKRVVLPSVKLPTSEASVTKTSSPASLGDLPSGAGFVSISSKQSPVEIYMDGSYLDATPITKRPISVGGHKMLFVEPDGTEVVHVLEVKKKGAHLTCTYDSANLKCKAVK